jgi:Fe-S-cluster-containing dehydrogenase component
VLTVKRFISFDPNACVGCHSCEVACKQFHKLPVGVFRIKIEKKIEKTALTAFDKKGLAMKFRARLCTQCDDAPCISACSVSALVRGVFGVVVLVKEKCNGCGACIDACPLQAMWLNPKTNTIEKCNTCVDEHFKIPPCVKHCMGGALKLELTT